MNLRTFASTCLVVASFSACGRLDLGDYRELVPEKPNGSSVLPPVSGGEASAGVAPVGGTPGDESPAAGAPPRGEGGADRAREPAEAGAGGSSAGEETGGAAGEPQARPSPCSAICGLDERNCCEALYVSAGEFVAGGIREGEITPPSHVSAFSLGTFEVTVARFGAFLENYDAWRATGAPRAGDGRHPRVPGSGWRPEWLRREGDPANAGLAPTREVVERERSTCLEVPFVTTGWVQPVNCVSFYEAMAFCIWDGGRLPTDLEWEYAAAGGDENRRYPWGNNEPTQPRAMYGCSANEAWLCIIPTVGSHPSGIGRFGQLDLAGSLSEWALDAVGPPLPAPCSDCANVEQLHDRNPRSTRGGNWMSEPSKLAVAENYPLPADLHLSEYGIRCAYDVKEP